MRLLNFCCWIRYGVRYWFIVPFFCFLSGCSLSGLSEGNEQARLKQASVIAVAMPDFNLPPGAKLAWYSDIILVRTEEDAERRQLIPFVRNEIQKTLTARGYQFVPEKGDSDYLVGVVIVLDEAMSDEQLAQRFRLHPSLKAGGDYKKGTLLLGFLNPRSLHAEWRGAIQVFTDQSLAIETRKERITGAVNRLINKVPY